MVGFNKEVQKERRTGLGHSFRSSGENNPYWDTWSPALPEARTLRLPVWSCIFVFLLLTRQSPAT